MYQVQTVENGVEATNVINKMRSQGYDQDQIYLFAHDPDRSQNLTDATDTEKVGIQEQGIFESIGNVFKSRGDELRSKMRAVGMDQTEAEHYEEELDKGKLVLVASDEPENLNMTRSITDLY